ncbi:hypothetical protein RhiXN_05588 [Rhizoctonia solani]|uniref:C2H2-type domain-containing protein n=1 Tax=Rhizoctonia solani TaxID=456999 RepID=A0A8H8NVD3_9AGAM|nr:uncharacterized protein RhiXN_05588 [Rhizoctonia solani]QRW20599.1 hypothetical protein RhiXN_05588 [Rhizoctonia solani]
MPARQQAARQEQYTCEYCSELFLSQRGYNIHVSRKGACIEEHRASIAKAEAGVGDAYTQEHEVEQLDIINKDALDDIKMEAIDIPWDELYATKSEEAEQPKHERIQGTKSFVKHFPVATAGAPIQPATEQELNQLGQTRKDVGPLSDPKVFKVAELLVTLGMSSKKRTKLLKLEQFQGTTPWNNNREMIMDVDKYLPRGLNWNITTMKLVGSNGSEHGQLWHQDSLLAISKMCKNPTFKHLIQWQPTRVWTSPTRETQKFGKTMAANRIWNLQASLKMHPDKHATLIPTFLASDKTTLTVHVGNQKAHCVYLTIGNIPKHTRRQISKQAMVLIGYIPVMSLDCKPDPVKKAHLKRKLFHACMRKLVEPLIKAGKHGVKVVCSDGFVRRIYPVFCGVPPDKCGDYTNYPLCNRERTLEAIEQHCREGSAVFETLGLVDIKPFWADLPWVDTGTLCPPDLLHQLYKGMFKDHLSKWSAHVVGAKEFDNRYIAMSPHHDLRHFKKGVTKISCWTGKEAKAQCKLFLPIVADQEPEVMACARALTRFMYLAHSLELTEDNLVEMDEYVQELHENKEIF